MLCNPSNNVKKSYLRFVNQIQAEVIVSRNEIWKNEMTSHNHLHQKFKYAIKTILWFTLSAEVCAFRTFAVCITISAEAM